MFSLILPGRPCLAPPNQVSQNQFAFTFPAAPHFSHVVVFMLPGNTLPPETAAAVYLQLPGEQQFKLLGAIGNEKQSAIFRVNLPGGGGSSNGIAADSMRGSILPATNPQTHASGQTLAGDVNVGISVEPAAQIQSQLSQLRAESSTMMANTDTSSTALVKRPPSTKVLAQRIIKNAFNFLASFAGNVGGPGGVEVVPLKSFQDWWVKFERRVENDPGFLERDQDDI